MLTTYKTAEQKYLFETYANEEGLITQKPSTSSPIYFPMMSMFVRKVKAITRRKQLTQKRNFLRSLSELDSGQSETEEISMRSQTLLNICSCVGTPTTKEDT